MPLEISINSSEQQGKLELPNCNVSLLWDLITLQLLEDDKTDTIVFTRNSIAESKTWETDAQVKKQTAETLQEGALTWGALKHIRDIVASKTLNPESSPLVSRVSDRLSSEIARPIEEEDSFSSSSRNRFPFSSRYESAAKRSATADGEDIGEVSKVAGDYSYLDL